MTASTLRTFATLTLVATILGCAEERPSSDDVVAPGNDITSKAPESEARTPTTPLRDVPGKLIAKGRIQILGVTEDGYVPYFLLSSGGQASLEVLDTKTNTSIHVGPAPFGSRVAVREKAIALWTNPQGTYWSGLTVWSAANGVATAPAGAGSIAPLLVANAEGTRLAMAWGSEADPFGVTNVATSGSTFAEAPKIVVSNVAVEATSCKPAMRFAGARLFVASCEGSQTGATVRTISDTNEVVTIKTNTTAAFSTDSAGAKVFVVGAGGEGEIHSVPGNAVTPVASNVVSGMLLPDGNSVVYTTTAGALMRGTTTLVPSGAREVLLVSADGKHAIVASNAGTSLRDLNVASLDSSGPLVPLVASPTGVPIAFTKSQGHFLYMTDSGSKVRAHAMASGNDIALGTDVSALALLDDDKRILVGEPSSGGSEVKIVDLDTGTAAPLVRGAFSATAYRNTAYYSIGFEGLYAVELD